MSTASASGRPSNPPTSGYGRLPQGDGVDWLKAANLPANSLLHKPDGGYPRFVCRPAGSSVRRRDESPVAAGLSSWHAASPSPAPWVTTPSPSGPEIPALSAGGQGDGSGRSCPPGRYPDIDWGLVSWLGWMTGAVPGLLVVFDPQPCYRPRNPQATALYKLLEDLYERVKLLGEDRFEPPYFISATCREVREKDTMPRGDVSTEPWDGRRLSWRLVG